MASARKPIASDSPSATTPRTIGTRAIACRFIGDSMSRETCAISPSGLRTATDQFDGPRIMTPSSTACPPIGFAMAASSLGPLRGLRPLEAALEALHPAAGVDELLLARVERVAVRADLDVQLRLRRAGLEGVPAGAVNRREHVLGVDAGLHCPARIATAVSAATLPPETTTATPFAPSSGTFPARSAATPTAPAGSQASFARLYRK